VAPGSPVRMGRVSGWRIWRINTSRERRQRLAELYRRLTQAILECAGLDGERLIEAAARRTGLPKGLLYYASDWLNMYKNVCERARDDDFRPPPLLLLVLVAQGSKPLHGTRAAAYLDIVRGELRIPSAAISVKVERSVIRELLEDLHRFPGVKLTLQLTCTGRLRLIAKREVKPARWDGSSKLAVIALDHNSAHGLFMMTFAFDDKVKMLKQVIRRPPNVTRLRLLSAFFQSLAETRSWSEAERRFAENRPAERGEATVRKVLELARRVAERAHAIYYGAVLKERARRIAETALRKIKKLNGLWMKKVESELRTLIRGLLDGGHHVAIVIDLPDPETLEGTELQKTLLRIARRLRNLALYEGAEYVELSGVSGRRCPLCGRWGIEVMQRYYRCAKCQIVWNRDWNACFRAAMAYLNGYKAQGHAEALLSWLKEHSKSLASGYYGSGCRPGPSGRGRPPARARPG